MKIPQFETYEECKGWCFDQAVPHRRLGYQISLHYENVPATLWHECSEDTVAQTVWLNNHVKEVNAY